MPTETKRPTGQHGTKPTSKTGARPPHRTRRPTHRKTPPRLLRILLVLLLFAVVIGVLIRLAPRFKEGVPSWVSVQIIDVNGGGRRGQSLGKVTDIAIHYVGNPGTTAQQNHDFYDQPDTEVSSHFVIGLEGEIIQCIPLDEKSSATNDRNIDTISIEVCHADVTGKFSEESYQSLVKLTAWLCDRFELDRSHVIRHYDVTGKLCPLYFVEHPEAWTQFLSDVKAYKQ